MMRALLLVVLTSVGWAQTQYVGPGATTATCIDWDSDGYGVGPGCTGPDADDGVTAIQTTAQGITTYGSFLSFIQHLGYNPTRIWYFDPVNGNNSNSCRAVAASFDPATTPRCASFNNKTTVVSGNPGLGAAQAGDMFLFRAGTVTTQMSAQMVCTSSAPCVFLVYPGETYTINHASVFSGINLSGNSSSYRCGSTVNTAPCTLYAEDYAPDQTVKYVTIDGFTVRNASGTSGQGIIGGSHDNVRIRNCHVYSQSRGIFMQDGITNLVIEKNVVHDNRGSHSLYLGARAAVARNVTVRYNILYNASLPHFQFNGRAENFVLDGNIIWGDVGGGTAGLALMQGGGTAPGYTSYIRNNLVYGVCNVPLNITNYPDPGAGIFQWPLHPLIIEGNTFVHPKVCSADGANNDGNRVINISMEGTAATEGQTNPTYYSGAGIASTITIRNNMLVNEGPSAQAIFIRVFTRSSTYNSYAGGAEGNVTPSVRSPDGVDFRTYGLRDPRTEAAKLVVKNNYFYAPYLSPTTFIRALNCNSDTDSASCTATGGASLPSGYGALNYINQGYAAADLPTLNAANTGNITSNADPAFVRAVVTDPWQPPFRYNYSLQASSSARAAGTSGTAVTDLAGVTRSSPPSIGAYEGATGSEVPSAPSITGSTLLPTGSVGSAYTSTTLTANGTVPITWTATGLPPGLTLSSSGTISGTPATAGTYTARVTATNGVSPDATRNYSLIVNPAPVAPTITTTSLPSGLVGAPYLQTLSATVDANAPNTWSITSGELPQGLSLNTTTGVISGIPEEPVTVSITFRVANSAGSDTETLSIVISQAALFTGISASGLVIR